ncbi:hypothetical protein ACJMK2_016123 [Sinanodonta woodiana]|uniref:Uncharacterized protein n=1 Tax=Sinanodonta woodiana TaxID=1069815 RepID=A0ABD3USM6_SINWO
MSSSTKLLEGLRIEDINLGLQNKGRGKYFLFSKGNILLYPNDSLMEIRDHKIKIRAPPPITRILGDKFIDVHNSVLPLEIPTIEHINKLEMYGIKPLRDKMASFWGIPINSYWSMHYTLIKCGGCQTISLIQV